MIRGIARQLTATGWMTVAALAQILLTVATCSWQSSQRDRADRAAAEARGQSATATAGQQAAVDALDATARAADVGTESENLTRSNRDDILNAPGAAATIDPRLSDAGLRSLCKRDAYRDSARCHALWAVDRGQPAG